MSTKVTREQVVKMFGDMGLPQAARQSNEALEGRLKVLPAKHAKGELKECKTQESQDLLVTLITNMEAGDTIEIVDEASNGKAAKGKGGKAAKDKPAGKEAKKAPAAKETGGADRDPFGNRNGTQAAQINAALPKKPFTIDDLAEKSGFGKARIQGHLKWLMDRGHVKEVEKGKYSLAPAGK